METPEIQETEGDVSITSERTVSVSRKNGKISKKKKNNKKKATTQTQSCEAQTAIPRRSKRKTGPADAATPPPHTDRATRTEASDANEMALARTRKDRRSQRQTSRIRAGGCGKSVVAIAGEESREASSLVNVDSGNCTLGTGGPQRTQTEDPPRFDAGESSRVALRDIMSRLFRLATPADPSQSDCPSTTEAASPSREITDAIEGMASNYKDLVQWLETFENTDAREAIGFDLAMAICGCYDIAIRGLAGSVKRLFSECKNVKILDDVPRADDIVECCAKFCADNTPTEALAKIVADRASRYDKLRSLADRLKPQESHAYISGIRDGLCERFEAFKETIVQLAVIINNTNDELSHEKETRQQLEQEKANIGHVLAAKEEEHLFLTERRNASSTSRIDELAKQLEEHKKIIDKMSFFHETEKRDWDKMKEQLATELHKTKTSLSEKTTQVATVQADSEQAYIRHKRDIDILARRNEELVKENQALQRAHVSELETVHNEHSTAQQTIARLEKILEVSAADSASQTRCLDELKRELESSRDELEFNIGVVSKLEPYGVAIDALSQVLDVDLKEIIPNDIPRIINNKAVRSASWIEGLLMRECVARGDTRWDEFPES